MNPLVKLSLFSALLLAGAGHCATTLAQAAIAESPFPKVQTMNWLNNQFLDKQRQRVDELTRNHFGKPLRVGPENLALLQRIIDESLLKPNDTVELQALGVVLGDAFVSYHHNLVWRVYEDELGKTHAVCVEGRSDCVFPITMLSRRMEVGIKPSVARVFDKGIAALKPFLPKLPYSN